MKDLPEKEPLKQEQADQRSATVDGLLADTMRGIKPGESPVNIATLDQPSSGSWQQFFSSASETLQKRSSLNPPLEKRTQNELLSEQLHSLNKLPAQDRNALIQGLQHNEKHFSAIEESSGKVRDAFRAGYMPAVIDSQRRVVGHADLINQNALAFEVQGIKDAAGKEQSSVGKAVLSQTLEEGRSLMAAPFIERARLSAFLSNDKKVYQAEKMLNEALKTQIPSESMESSYVKELVKNATEQLSRLKVENHLLELYDANLAKIDISPKDGVITQTELNAAKSKDSSGSFHALAEFLSDNYKSLTGRHWSLFGKEGIRRSDIIDYEKERSKNINDLDL